MSDIIDLSSVPQSSVSGQVPRREYTVRFCGGKANKSGKGFSQIVAKFEIITPDVVELPGGGTNSVAGRKGQLYLTYDPAAKSASDAIGAMQKLGLLSADKKLDKEAAINTLQSGQLFAKLLLDSKERIEKDAFGNVIVVDGKPMTNGWEFTYTGANSVISKAEPIDGLPPVVQEAAGTDAPY